MKQKTIKITFPIYTVSEYLDIVREKMVVDNQILIGKGFPKWDQDDPRLFIEAVSFTFSNVWMPDQYLLDTGDREWIWLVNMSTAMVIKKT